jgi:serine/threonine protein kinase
MISPGKPKYTNNGTYGCVMTPGVSCKNPKPVNNTVSKIFNSSEVSQEEWTMYKNTIRKIDPENRFTVKLYDYCDIPMNQFPSAEISKCKNFSTSDMLATYLPQILYEHGGYDVHESCRRYTFDEIFKAMRPVFEGISILASKKYVHMDIKPLNLVYNHATGKMAIIDFGLASKSHDVYKFSNLYLFKHLYEFYPPEFLVAANKYSRPNAYDEMRNYYLIFDYIPTLTDNSIKSDEFKKEVRTIKDIDTNSLLNSKNVFDALKIDTFMLGVSLFQILFMSKKHKKVDIDSNPKFYIKVIQLVKKMIQANPKERISAADALVEYDKVLNILKKQPTPVLTKISPKVSPLKIKKKDSPQREKPCPPGKELNPATGRCRKIKVDAKDKPCPPGKVRDPVTKRCRKVEMQVKPCPPGKELNPATGRCRKIKVDINDKPCPPGKVRDPVTKRCRKEIK